HAATISSARYDIEEATRSLTDYLDELDADPSRLDAVQERLATLGDLKRKYGATIEDVLAYADDAVRRLESLEHSEEHAEALKAKLAEAREDYASISRALSESRRSAAERFRSIVENELAQLAMERARFDVRIEPAAPSEAGADAVEFMLAPNPGEPLRPLARIASGGEISRVMLAIKSALAIRSPLPTLVFDEIDVGIGGRTASVIGEKMRALASTAQVLCITHLPQIAACAQTQYGIRKVEEDGRSVVAIEPLDAAARIEELARMLAGADVTEAAREHVRAMLSRISE
ncbi:MAG: DNA repair protein RecN, partial [Chthonomonadales bacterium]|nr:DNA repair protein RecN [Chthonomonadales bacterium]